MSNYPKYSYIQQDRMVCVCGWVGVDGCEDLINLALALSRETLWATYIVKYIKILDMYSRTFISSLNFPTVLRYL